jgi:hypothetical protein
MHPNPQPQKEGDQVDGVVRERAMSTCTGQGRPCIATHWPCVKHYVRADTLKRGGPQIESIQIPEPVGGSKQVVGLML